MIYKEIVHLDADNRVLIEVLDGRTVRVTIDAHPMEVFYDKKKVSEIRISGITYLSLYTFNKVFVTIEDKLHTYEISDIEQLAENCFQCHTMQRTKSSFFITPMLGKSRIDVRWGQYFVNTFVDESKKAIFVLYRFFHVEDYKQFEHSLTKNPMFQKLIDYDEQHVAIQYKVPEDMENNFQMFCQGKYSQMSHNYKVHILNFHGLAQDTLIGRVLFKSEERKKQLEMDLGVTIPQDVELYDKPDSREMFKKKEDLTLAI